MEQKTITLQEISNGWLVIVGQEVTWFTTLEAAADFVKRGNTNVAKG
jgi:hypothetical protein